MDRLLYDYDTETNKISPLPASPLLLPAIIVLGIFYIFNAIWRLLFGNENMGVDIKKYGVSSEIISSYRNKYFRLKAIERRRPLSFTELNELHRVEYPPWGRGHKWQYK